MKMLVGVLFLFVINVNSYSQISTTEELELYESIMKYRKQKGLPRIPLSISLTQVAQMHVMDLADNKPDIGDCNSHSWSGNGKWTACCYTRDHKEAACMWNKPKELTLYPGRGYEIATGSNDCCSDFIMTAQYALEGWIESNGHHAVIINQGIWKDVKWKAIGVGLYKGFAVVWFGEESDPTTKVETK